MQIILYNTFGRCSNFSVILHVVITNLVYFLTLKSQQFIFGYLHSIFLLFSFLYFCKQEMRYCSEDASQAGERNVNLNKNASENAALNEINQSCRVKSSIKVCLRTRQFWSNILLIIQKCVQAQVMLLCELIQNPAKEPIN